MISKEVYWLTLKITRSVVVASIVAVALLASIARFMGTTVIQLAWPYPYGDSYILIRSAAFTRFIKWIVKNFDASVHAPMKNLGENNEMRRVINHREVMATIRYSIDCGVKLITLHLADNDWNDSWPLKRAIKTAANCNGSLESFNEIFNGLIHGPDFFIAIENLTEPAFQQIKSFEHLFGEHVGLTLDIAHWISQNPEKCPADLVALIKKYQKHLRVVHLTTTVLAGSQINGPVKHYAYDAKGVYDITPVLKALLEIGFQGPVIMEVDLWDLRRSWKWLNKTLRLIAEA